MGATNTESPGGTSDWLEVLEKRSKVLRSSKEALVRLVVEGKFGDRLIVDVPLIAAGTNK